MDSVCCMAWMEAYVSSRWDHICNTRLRKHRAIAVRKPNCTEPMTFPIPLAPEDEDDDEEDCSRELDDDRLPPVVTSALVPVVTADNSALNAAAAVPISAPRMVKDGSP